MTPEQEIRAKALELAIAANLTRPSGTAELEDVAKDFEAYIAGPAPATGQIFNGSEEPPIGRYKDWDGDEWTRTVDGWHWRGSDEAQSWEHTRRYGPFTKVEE